VDDVDLHDALLDAITVDWQARTAELRLSAVGRGATIRAVGLVALHATRAEPWGPSDSVLDAELSADARRLVLHMQSGDDVVVEADEITIS
jgi:hypothetical protein